MEHTLSGVGVLDKSMTLLAAAEHQPRSLAGLVEATGFSRATTHRLAAALEQHGLLRRDGDGRYALGLRLVALGRAAVAAEPLREAARPVLEALRDETGESVQLYVRQGDRRVCIESLESPHGLRTIVPLGASLTLSAGSAGKVLRDVPGVKQQGWAESAGEREAGVASVSAPVLDGDGVVRAAVSVSGPIDRTGRRPGKRYAEAVMLAARRIEAAALLRG